MSKIGEDLILGMENAVAHGRGQKRAARETVVPVSIPDTVDDYPTPTPVVWAPSTARKAETYRGARRAKVLATKRPRVNLQGPFEYVAPVVRCHFNYAGRKVRM